MLAQSSAFNYQGRLNEAGNAAAGNYQFQFKLYDAAVGGSQVGSTLSDVTVAVNAGIFSTNLDFGAPALSGADRYLEISVRKTAGDAYTVLTPRQKIVSSPYASRAAVATSALNFSGTLAGDVSGTQGATVVNSVGGSGSERRIGHTGRARRHVPEYCEHARKTRRGRESRRWRHHLSR